MLTLDIAHQRLRHQHLAGPPYGRPEAVVQGLVAVQAQDFAGAKWAIAQRTPGATNAELDRLMAEGALVRTHVLRPTWHFVRPEDLRWLLALTAPRIRGLMAHCDRKLELTPELLAKSSALIGEALAGGRQLTRTELSQALDAGGIEAKSQRLGHLVMHAELDGLIASGGLRGKQFTYALVDERIPPTPTKDREAALAELARRYFTGHGPATIHDFAWWSGLTMGDARAAVALNRAHLTERTVGDQTLWMSEDTPAPPADKPLVHLLPPYDEFTVAFRDRRALIDGVVPPDKFNGEDGLLTAIITVDGRVTGTWGRTVTARGVVVRTTWLRPVDADALEMAGLLNAIIGAGAYTAMDTRVTLEDQRDFIRTFPPRGVFHVALDADGRLVGMQDVLPMASRAQRHVGEISTFVSPDVQGQGVGGALMTATVDAARSAGLLKLMATIRADNPGAIAYYQRQGFRVIGTAEAHAWVRDAFIDEVIAERRLD